MFLLERIETCADDRSSRLRVVRNQAIIGIHLQIPTTGQFSLVARTLELGRTQSSAASIRPAISSWTARATSRAAGATVSSSTALIAASMSLTADGLARRYRRGAPLFGAVIVRGMRISSSGIDSHARATHATDNATLEERRTLRGTGPRPVGLNAADVMPRVS